MATGRWEDEIKIAELGSGVDRGANNVAHILMLAVVGFFGTFLLWAYNATLDEVTRGEGKIVPSGQTKIIQHFEGGIVTEILVDEGDIVEQGAVLLRVQNVSGETDLAAKKEQYRTYLAMGARLEAETQGLEAIDFPDEVLANASSSARNEQTLFQSRRRQLQQQVQILRDQRSQTVQELRELEAKVGQLDGQLQLSQQEAAILEPLVRQGAASQVELIRVRRDMEDMESQIQSVKLAIPRTRSAVSEANRRIDEKNASFVAEAQQELNEVRVKAASLEEEIRAGVDREQRTDVRSPVRGSVNKMLINTIGGVVRPGDPILEIVPLGDKLIVEAKILPADRAQLYPGLPATVKVSAYDFSIHGGLAATLLDISADTITNEEGDSHYRIRLRTEDNNLGPDKPIIPGMTATVDILTGEKTVLENILSPAVDAWEKALTEK